MLYKVGMYGGSFDPLHIGHVNNIFEAASVCEELYIVLSWCEGRESVSKEVRYRWIHNVTKHLPNTKILLVEDTAKSKEEYNVWNHWKDGADTIKKLIGKQIDAVFCGSDYSGTNLFESLYPDSRVVYFDRSKIKISSTEIRKNVYKNWQYLPTFCRRHYVKKVLVVGGESTGKSTLVQNLAIAYGTNFVKEVGRETCEIAGGEEYMNVDDLIENLVRQKAEEIKQSEYSNKILFVDTDALTTKFYVQFLLSDKNESEACSKLADAISEINRFDLVLFLEPTVEFVQDGTRNETIAKDREKYSNQIRDMFDAAGIKCISLGGSYLNRFNWAKKLISSELKINI